MLALYKAALQIYVLFILQIIMQSVRILNLQALEGQLLKINSESKLLTRIALQNSCAKNFSRVTAVTLWQANNLLHLPSTKVS